MAESNNESVVQWKRLWQLTSGIYYATPNLIVKQKLLDVSKELSDGLKQYKKNTQKSSDELEKLLKENNQKKLALITTHLTQYLDIDALQAWDILTYYLVNEFKGSSNSLSSYISTESNMIKLLDDIWRYYSLERMIVLKLIKNIIELHAQPKHPYHAEYKAILERIGIAKFRKSLIEQLNDLIKESPPSKITISEYGNHENKLVSWSERRCREINEILQILILIINDDGIVPSELITLLELFKINSFGRQMKFMSYSNENHVELKNRLCYNQIALFVTTMNCGRIQLDKMIVDKLDKIILTIYQNEEHGPILLTWMLYNFQERELDEDGIRKYSQIHKKSVQLNVFAFMYKMLRHSMFSDLKNRTASILRRSIYRHLDYMCGIQDIDCFYGCNNNDIYELFSELLKTPEISLEFIENEDSDVWAVLYNLALQDFPVQFVPLALITASLSSSANVDVRKFIKNQIENLPMYTEPYNMNKYQIQRNGNNQDKFFLVHDYRPFNKLPEFLIPKGTECYIVDIKNHPTLIHFETKFNFYNGLYNEILELLGGDMTDECISRVEIGLRCLKNVLKGITSQTEITSEMCLPIERIFDIFIKFNKNATWQKENNAKGLELLSYCMDICGSLVVFYESEIVTRILTLNLIPIINNDSLDYKKCAMGLSFGSGLVGDHLINYERNYGRYNFLLSYFEFLQSVNSLEENQTLFKIKLSGLIFLLREVFPTLHQWRFISEKDRDIIYIKTMKYFLNILENAKNDLISNTCIFSLLNLENGLILLRFIGIGNSYLTVVTENDVNWITITNNGLNLIIQLSIKILMFLLKFKNNLNEVGIQYPLESIIFMQSKYTDALHLIPNITSYMNNIFNRCLPVLSCRLLRRFAIEFGQISLLACLDMEPDQVRLTFLQRLSDDFENDDLKIAVLEFVESCIEKQYGITESFFDIKLSKSQLLLLNKETNNILEKSTNKKLKNISDSILIYMSKYLNVISDDPKNIESPILSHIMSLFHALWKKNLTILIESLIEKSNFWPSLCKPLFCEKINTNIKIYAQLFNIMGIELFKVNDASLINPDLKTILNNFLEISIFKKWITIIFAEVDAEHNVIDEIPLSLQRLQSFKDLIVIITRKNIAIKIPENSYNLIFQTCLDTLVNIVQKENDFRQFIIISELLSILLSGASSSDIQITPQYLEQIQYLIRFLSVSYEEVHIRSRNSILAIGIKIFYLLGTANANVETVIDIIKSVVDILLIELNEINMNKGEALSKPQINSILLAVSLFKKIVLNFSNVISTELAAIFLKHKIFIKILSSLSVITNRCEYHPITIELLNLLIILNYNMENNDVIYLNIGEYLWLKLLPPKELLTIPQTPEINQTDKMLWKADNWYNIYSKSIELLIVLLKNNKFLFIKDVLVFIGIHEEYLIDSLLLIKHELNENILDLVKKIIELISEVVPYEKLWRIEHGQSMFNLMRCVQLIIEQSVSLLYRPNILKQMLDESKASRDGVTEVMNELLDFIILSTKSLVVFSPKLLDLLAEPEFVPSKWFPLIEIQVGPPKLEVEEFPPLTLQTLLKAIVLFVKSLNLQYVASKKPLNYLPSEKHKQCSDELDTSVRSFDVNESSQSLLDTKSHSMFSKTLSPRPQYSKSVSVSSTSTMIPSNEVLKNLDCGKCCLALEFLMTLLASQSLHALKDVNLSNREKQLIRREISTELSNYHDFVRKKVIEARIDNILIRKKLGIEFMKLHDDSDDDDVESMDASDNASSKQSGSSRTKISLETSMRKSLLRRQHLQHQVSSDSPSRSVKSRSIVTSTPSSTSTKRVIFDDGQSGNQTPKQKTNHDINDRYDIDVIEYFEEPEDSKFAQQSYVKLVESDYFHLLSIVFSTLRYFED